MKKIKWILPLGLTATAAAIAPAITSCSCFKSYNVNIECVPGEASDLNGIHFKVKYHRTIDKKGTWVATKRLSWEVIIGKTKYISGQTTDDKIKIYNTSSDLYIHIDGQKVDAPIKIILHGSN